MASTYIPTREELIVRVEATLPQAIVSHATAGETLEEAFEYPDIGLYEFGDRLIMVAGLSLCVLYVDLASADQSVRGEHYIDFIRTILFQRGYDRGLACALFQRLDQIDGPIFASLRGEDGPVSTFSSMQRHGAANSARARKIDPLESHLSALIERVSFLRRFSFAGDGSVTFDGRAIEIWPFFRWDGTRLRRIREPHDRNEERLPEALEWVGGDEHDSEIASLSFAEKREMKKIARLVFYQTADALAPVVAPVTESVLPLFADTHPQMNKLAGLIQSKANSETRAKLLAPFLTAEQNRRVTPKEALARVDDAVLMENAIIRECIEKDPVAVLKTYLEDEPGDTIDCLTFLSGGDTEMALRMDAAIAALAEARRKGLEPLYPHEAHAAEIDREIDGYTALLSAKEVARLLGFRIVEQYAQESIDAYIVRVSAFARYVHGRRPDRVKVAGGLLECSKIAHDILRFLTEFYTMLKYYDPQYEEGLSPTAKELLQKESQSIWKRDLFRATEGFRSLGREEAVVTAVQRHLGRPMWSEAEGEKHTKALDDFRQDWRNRYAHESGLPDEDAEKLVTRFLEFLKWLRDPTKTESHRDRIYPAVLHLNVLTLNQCGITSVKYCLTENSADDATVGTISLYTRQPLANFAGVFYGLPNQGKSQEKLWVDPVLIPTNVFPRR